MNIYGIIVKQNFQIIWKKKIQKGSEMHIHGLIPPPPPPPPAMEHILSGGILSNKNWWYFLFDYTQVTSYSPHHWWPRLLMQEWITSQQ